ncbi:MAG: hypothetical protein PIR02_15955 [Microbacterium enclense]
MAKFYPIKTQLERSIEKGLRKAGTKVLKRMKELSPDDTGDSDKTGFSTVDDLTLQVGFTSPVKRWSNEDLDAKHTNGQAKFAEAAVDQVDIGVVLAEQHKADLGG